METKRQRRRKISKGFTIIEIMVVLVIIGILGTLLAPMVMDRPDQARVTKAKADIRSISSALKLYKLDNGFYPSTEQGLSALVIQPDTDPVPLSWKPNGYLEGKETPKDPWGRDYIYRTPGENGEEFELISLGADGREGGSNYDADISSSNL